MKTLETKRLILKNIGLDDAEFFYKEFSTDEVNTYLYDAEPVSSLEEAMEWIGFFTQGEVRQQHRWILVLKEKGEKIGTIGYHCWDEKNASAEIGYDLQPQYWRQGYMSEAMEAVLCFLKEVKCVKTVYAHIAEGNTASVRTVEKFGFEKTGKTYFEEFHGEKYLHDIYRLSFI